MLVINGVKSRYNFFVSATVGPELKRNKLLQKILWLHALAHHCKPKACEKSVATKPLAVVIYFCAFAFLEWMMRVFGPVTGVCQENQGASS